MWPPPKPVGINKEQHKLVRRDEEDEEHPRNYLELDKWLHHCMLNRRRALEAGDGGSTVKLSVSLFLPFNLLCILSFLFEPHQSNCCVHLLMSIFSQGEDAAGQARHKSLQEQLTEIRVLEQDEGDRDSRTSRGHYAMDSLNSAKVSFAINLFPGGFSIEGQNEAHPYDRTYKDFLQSIDNGVLPAESLVDLPGHVDFTYYDGMCTLFSLCEGLQPALRVQEDSSQCNPRCPSFLRTCLCEIISCIPVLLPCTPQTQTQKRARMHARTHCDVKDEIFQPSRHLAALHRVCVLSDGIICRRQIKSCLLLFSVALLS